MDEVELLFKHALVQEATYESILLQRRRELHRRVGECVEALFADRLDEFYGLLAYHYSRAEEWEKAQDFLFKAGDQAGKVAADAEALEHYRQALAAYSRAFGDRWDPLQRAELERKMGEALFRRGEQSQAREY
jgi:predicted ATPase